MRKRKERRSEGGRSGGGLAVSETQIIALGVIGNLTSIVSLSLLLFLIFIFGWIGSCMIIMLSWLFS